MGQDARNIRPSAVTLMGVQGAIRHLHNTMAGAIASIPSCRGEAWLAAIVREYAHKMTPLAPVPGLGT